MVRSGPLGFLRSKAILVGAGVAGFVFSLMVQATVFDPGGWLLVEVAVAGLFVAAVHIAERARQRKARQRE